MEEELQDLKERYDQSKQKEAQLLQELRKRGDLARHLCSTKDEEIKQLREMLHYEQKAVASKRAGNASPDHRKRSMSGSNSEIVENDDNNVKSTKVSEEKESNNVITHGSAHKDDGEVSHGASTDGIDEKDEVSVMTVLLSFKIILFNSYIHSFWSC
jgi:hypothetical protein